ncbi:hypothetical protein HOP52_14090 [Halomonas campisalis]|uniref:Lipoprotein n=1 Tax=Billgrantia campisalis TaxID=74661 RepID=A0ABS9PB64_9GAMM|nr:YbaY family lipoprotein [Halomonas campisalis]MCG6658886.1 hypothetical protein [Halomonas campisalis]MDR5864814.1 YbaY family lipoprotein [Halomonas campisalis]
MPLIHRLPIRLSRLALTLLAVLVLAGCAASPDFTELRTRVIPPADLALAEDAELRVYLRDAGGILAETRLDPLDSGPWPVVLRYDRGALAGAEAPRLSAELRQAGRLTHATPEPVALAPEAATDDVDLPLAVRP